MGKMASHLRSVEVQVRPRRGGTALSVVAGAVNRRSIGVLGGRTGPEKAELPDLHPRPQLDRQRRDVGQLQRDVPREPRVDPPSRRVREQAQPSKTALAF